MTCGRRHSLACECAAPESSSAEDELRWDFADPLPADDGDADTEQLLLVAMPASALLLVCAGAATCYKRHATVSVCSLSALSHSNDLPLLSLTPSLYQNI